MEQRRPISVGWSREIGFKFSKTLNLELFGVGLPTWFCVAIFSITIFVQILRISPTFEGGNEVLFKQNASTVSECTGDRKSTLPVRFYHIWSNFEIFTPLRPLIVWTRNKPSQSCRYVSLNCKNETKNILDAGWPPRWQWSPSYRFIHNQFHVWSIGTNYVQCSRINTPFSNIWRFSPRKYP